MSFLEQFISEIAFDGIYSLFKWIGIGIKWIFFLGKKNITEIEKEDWNRRIGFVLFLIILSITLYILN